MTAYAQGTAFLPRLASANPPAPVVETANMHFYEYAGCGMFFGEIRNATPYVVNARLTVLLLDEQGTPVGSVDGAAWDMPPGVKIPFKTHCLGSVPRWASFSTNVSWQPVTKLQVVSSELTELWLGGWQLTVLGRNTSPVEAVRPQVVGALYAADGSVIGVNDLQIVDETVQPGEVFTTTLHFFSSIWDDAIEVASHSAVVTTR